jgi:hypothetical protein
MASGFLPFGNEANAPSLCADFAIATDANDGNGFNAGFQPHRHKAGRPAGAGGYHRHSFFGRDSGGIRRMGAHQHNIDAERPVSKRTGDGDLFAQVAALGIHGRNNAKAASVGYRRGKPAVGDPRHAALEYRIVDAYPFTYNRSYHF